MEHSTNGSYRGLWRVVGWGGATLLLLAPLLAMQFSEEVRWSGSDFAAFAVMLAVPLGILELVVWAVENTAYRAAVTVALGTSFLMIWVNLSVGIIGSEHDVVNMVFFGVLAIGLVGACIARFRARGMARAMVAMGVGQTLVAVIALIDGHVTVLLTGFFIAAWFGAAWLFLRAARDQAVQVAA